MRVHKRQLNPHLHFTAVCVTTLRFLPSYPLLYYAAMVKSEVKSTYGAYMISPGSGRKTGQLG